jgi:hypothetical protein
MKKMPVSLKQSKVTCQSCSWSKVVSQQGDVIFMPKQCELCGGDQLIHESTLEVVIPKPFNLVLKK